MYTFKLTSSLDSFCNYLCCILIHSELPLLKEFIVHKQLFIHTYKLNILSAMLVCLESLDLHPLDIQ